jgi:hypothetical protein
MKPKLLILGIAVSVLLMGVAANAEPIINIDSVDVGVSNDFPLGNYQSKSAYNLGVSAKLNTRLTAVPYLRPFLEVDNNYWLATPGWISFGTQINGLIGLDVLYPIASVPGVGVFSVGGGLGYGIMAHIVQADRSGNGNSLYSFCDQTLLVESPCQWHPTSWPVDVLLTPRFLFSPELNNQKYQIGVVTGVKISLGGEQ